MQVGLLLVLGFGIQTSSLKAREVPSEVDTTPPTAICRTTTLYVGEAGVAFLDAKALDGGSYDDVTPQHKLEFVAERKTFTCADLGKQQVILTVYDEAGNTAACLGTVNVVDETVPIFTQCPESKTVRLEPGKSEAKVSWELPHVSDVCEGYAPPPAWEGYTFIGSLNENFYYVSHRQVDWNTAYREAQKLGGHLVTITSEFENEFLNKRIAFQTWMGLTDREEEGIFTWVTGEPLDYENWRFTEPNDAGGIEDVVEFTAEGTWNDNSDFRLFRYIVEFEENPAFFREGFQFLGMQEGSLYYLSNEARTWKDAKSLAESLGGHLAVINSQAENDFLFTYNPGLVWMGLSDKEQEGDFRWVNGDPLNYTNFFHDPDDPDPAAEDYVMMYGQGWPADKAGKWEDVPDMTNAFFVEVEGAFLTQVAGPENGSYQESGEYVIRYVAWDGSQNRADCSFKITVGSDCEASAGTLRAGNSPGCFNGKEVFLKVREATPPNVPAGFKKRFVLTKGTDLILQEVSPQPVFGVQEPGFYTLHTLVYDPATLNPEEYLYGPASDLLEETHWGTCLAWDGEGYAFNIKRCGDCEADAGTLKVANDPGCFDGAREVFLKATPGNVPSIPQGYVWTYLLTKGNNKVIQRINNEALFGVESTGKYAIHAFVYDPNVFDLNRIRPGVTTAGEILAWISNDTQCADLDPVGAMFNITACEEDLPPCEADAGTLRPGNTPGCFTPGKELFFKARDGIAPFIPPGYQALYFISREPDHIIEKFSERPIFGIDEFTPGAFVEVFTIQRLVYNSNTLNPYDHEGQDWTNLLGGIQANEICASIDPIGVSFRVEPCSDPNYSFQSVQTSPNSSNFAEIRVYPNPGKEALFVELHGPSGAYALEMFTIGMKSVYQKSIKNTSGRVRIPLESFSEGFYYLTLRRPDGKMIVEKIVIQR